MKQGTMMRKAWLLMIAGVLPGTVHAQQAAPAAPAATATAEGEDAETGDDIVVTGSRQQPGAVVGDIPADQQLSPADIRSYGVNSVAELLDELSPQTTSGRGSGGAPVVLLNGRRISGFQEIRDIPTEAIQRVDILPEEVALKYGYRADQKVVNFVLRRRFRAATVELSDRQATAGGQNTPQGELDLLSIQRDGRANLHVEYQQSDHLLESDRDISAAASDDGTASVDQTPYRTLLPATRTFSANGIYAHPIGKVSATVNGRIEVTDSTGLFGLPSITLTTPADGPFAAGTTTRVVDVDGVDPLAQRTGSITSHLGSTLNGDLGRWRWSFTGNYDRVATMTSTDTGLDTTAFQARLDARDPLADPAGTLLASAFGALPGNYARSVSNTGGGDMLLNGSLFELPAGAMSTSIRVGASTSDFDSRSLRSGVTQTGQVSRDIVNGQVNIDVPIARRGGALGAIGSLSANVNLAVDQLSDFGTLATTGYGVNWSPVEAIRLIASVTDQEEAPTATQLGAASVTTPNVRVFDYANGTTATVTTVSGGNPLLASDDRHVEKLGLTVKPWRATDLVLTANYVNSRTDNPIYSFPGTLPAIEAAFPDRVTRVDGTLVRVDTTPINLARSERSELRWGINFSKPLKSKIQRELEAYRAGTGPNPFAGLRPPGGAQAAGGFGGQGGGAPGGGGAGGGPGGGRGFGGGPGGGGFGGRGGGQAGGRLQFALYHTWHFTDRVLVTDGGPWLNLLDGDAVGSSGGQPRHELEGQAGYTNNGLGARLSANYQSATQVNGLTTADDLRFGDLATLNLRLFADFGGRLDWVRAHPWLRGARVAVSVDNLFNTRQRVTDVTGAVPVSYQPAYLDALGRTVRVTVRKLFF